MQDKDTPSTPDSAIPYGYCHCGCGQKTALATRTSKRLRTVKGEPQRFIRYHKPSAQVRACHTCKRQLSLESFDRYTLNGKPKGWNQSCRECCQDRLARYQSHPNPEDPSGTSRLIRLTKGRHAIVDAADADLVTERLWSALETTTGNCYAVNYQGDRFVYLHRFLLDPDDGIEVDHINRDGLDNRRSNLRLATSQQNKWNIGLLSTNKSGFRGVQWFKFTKKWKASISVNNENRTIGYFDDPVEAALAYDAALRELAGEFGAYNFPQDGEQQVA